MALAWRLIKTGSREAYFAIAAAVIGVLLSPLDWMLSAIENRRYAKASGNQMPIVIVVGPPRSGTTLVAQVLIDHLPVSYINNLTSIFPRSPITANAILGRFLPNRAVGYQRFYGKSRQWSGVNDGLYIWDRWLGHCRTQVPIELAQTAAQDMAIFFGAFEAYYRKPLVNKVNRLNTCAGLISNILDNVTFICLDRDPVLLAQSLLRARQEITGDLSVPYGVDHRSGQEMSCDVVEDVCDQVIFHRQVACDQQKLIGKEKFWIVSYESFCDQPHVLVERVAREVLKTPIDTGQLRATLKPFKASKRCRIERELFDRFEQKLRHLRTDRTANQ